MSGIFDKRTALSRAAARVACVALLATLPATASPSVPPVSRAQMIATAKALAEHQWVCKAANRLAPCVSAYRSRFRENANVTGVAYDWGGMDDIAAFDQKLAEPQAAGSHKEEGDSACTTGIDCSGLVSLCWGQTTKYGTSRIGAIADALTIDLNHDLQPGDALNLAGTHIVLFAGYNADGTFNVYQASGKASRVVLTLNATVVSFPNYKPIRYKGTTP